jgi:protein tyrosine phosphatase domain-containing protein 1
MNEGISFFNFFWPDLKHPTFDMLLNTAQVMDFIIKQGGKCLVHCHAGQGRTAILIGAYLLLSGLAKDDKEAVAQTRLNRPKCFSRTYNQRFMKIFHEQLREVKQVFPLAPTFGSKVPALTLKQIMQRQG